MGWDFGKPYIPFMFQGIWSSLQWSNRSWWGSFPLPFCSSRAAQTRVCGRFGPPLGPWSSEPVPCGCCKVVVLLLHLFACFRGWGFGYFRWANGEEGPWHRSTWRRTKEGTWALACFLPLVAQDGGGPCAVFFLFFFLSRNLLAAAFVVSTKKHAYDNNGIMYCIPRNNVQNVDSRSLFATQTSLTNWRQGCRKNQVEIFF